VDFFGLRLDVGDGTGFSACKSDSVAGGGVIGSATTVESYNVTLGQNGQYQFYTPRTTGFEISVKGSKWLRKTQKVFETSGDLNGLNLSLKTGDVDPNNVVDLTDYTKIATSFNALPDSGLWNSNADLNEDGIIDLTDYTFVAVNFNVVGDD
jgi:hypothetical protein